MRIVATFLFWALFVSMPAYGKDSPPKVVWNAMLGRCLTAIVKNKPMDVAGLTKWSEERSLSYESGTEGHIWESEEQGFLLVPMRSSSKLAACRVETSPSNPKLINLTRYQMMFDRVIEGLTRSGRYSEIPVCDSSGYSYMRMLESQFKGESGLPVRVLLAVNEKLGFYLFFVSEIRDRSRLC